MAIDELIKVERQIDEILLVNRFGVTLENEHRVIAFTAGKIRRYRIHSAIEDRVHVEMTPNNPTLRSNRLFANGHPVKARQCPP